MRLGQVFSKHSRTEKTKIKLTSFRMDQDMKVVI